MEVIQTKIIDQARHVVSTVVAEKGLHDPKSLRAALYAAYPFERRYGYRYHAWLSVIKKQIGGMRPTKPDPRQMILF